MNQVQVEQRTYQMPPKDGITVAHFLTVADVERSLRFYETVFGGRILTRGDSSGAPGYIQIANTWLLVNPQGARLVALEGQNHVILEGEPAFDRFLEELRSFLSSDVGH
jgi:catechol 2,3-dioxygenase-like lactoylglutathione lyase family enzyme